MAITWNGSLFFAALAEHAPEGGESRNCSKSRRIFAGTSFAATDWWSVGERVSGKRRFGSFAAVGKGTRGALPGQRIICNNHIRRLWKGKFQMRKL
jgi:hypothetical protein